MKGEAHNGAYSIIVDTYLAISRTLLVRCAFFPLAVSPRLPAVCIRAACGGWLQNATSALSAPLR